jgi:hypothetical protein
MSTLAGNILLLFSVYDKKFPGMPRHMGVKGVLQGAINQYCSKI